jgi:hypothetical protein
LIIIYRRFWTTYLSHLHGSSSLMGPKGCPQTSVSNHHSTLHNIPEEWRFHLHRDGSLKSSILGTALNDDTDRTENELFLWDTETTFWRRCMKLRVAIFLDFAHRLILQTGPNV